MLETMTRNRKNLNSGKEILLATKKLYGKSTVFDDLMRLMLLQNSQSFLGNNVVKNVQVYKF